MDRTKGKTIGIDCRMWAETGIGRYIRNIVKQLGKADSENKYILFMLSKDLDSIDTPGNFRKVPADIRWHTFAEQTKLPLLYLKHNLDLLFVPHFNVPVLYPKDFVSTVHDLTILRVKTGRATTLPYPMYLMKRLAFRFNVFNTVNGAKKIFTVSDFVKRDLENTFRISGEKIIITPNAVSADFSPVLEEKVIKALEKYSIGRPYLFYVGNAHPHKNLERLIKAFKKVSVQNSNLTLVLGGKKEFFYDRLEEEISADSIAQKVKIIGFVDDDDLPALYTGAEAFVNPSLYEGFGIQVLESFACGTKVICSNTTSLPEVGGEAAFYFDPRDVSNMAETITQALKVPHDEQAGFDRVKSYSWEESAAKILRVLTDQSS